MSDFHQHGPVTALPRLACRDAAVMERRLEALAPRTPVALVIPMVPAEMDRPALAGILEELRHVRYLDSLVVSLNHAGADDYQRTCAYFEAYAGPKVVLWNESPAIEGFVREMAGAGLYTGGPGKGRACWLAVGHVLAQERAAYVAFQDADVVNFSRAMLAQLLLPALEPSISFDFVKAYYARVSDRLHGRVTRLLLTPLLAAFTRLIGLDPYVRYLSSFRYALSGEFVMKTELAERLRVPCDWGLEIVTLFEALRHGAPGRIGQVEIAERYEHKHQELSAEDPTRGLNRMARDVIKHLLRTLAAAGVNLAPGLLMSLQAAYQREAEDAVGDSHAVALVNGLVFDRHSEERSVQTFSLALRAAIDEFLDDPLGPPLLPNWDRIRAGLPDAGVRLVEAVERGLGVPAGVAGVKDAIVFSDLDGCLLDRETYGFAAAAPALAALREQGVPLVLCSSKTRAEMERLATRLLVRTPLVVENGGAVVDGGHVLALGLPRARLLAALPQLARDAGVDVRGFSEMTIDEVAWLTGLDHAAAALALQREFDEPFAVLGAAGREPALDARLDDAARPLGLRVTHGGLLHHLHGPADKGDGVRAVLGLVRRSARGSIGLGDSATDVPLLRAVERPIVVPGPKGVDPALAAALPGAERAPEAGPAGWNAALLAVLAGTRLPPVAA